jgi:tetratricopeptide (TPR) repeat protein
VLSVLRSAVTNPERQLRGFTPLFRDALDAYSRAIRINSYISEVWFDLGSLYESCNNQISDAIDAYARASELDPSNHVISQCPLCMLAPLSLRQD